VAGPGSPVAAQVSPWMAKTIQQGNAVL